MMYNILLYLRCSAKINLMVFPIHVVLRSGAEIWSRVQWKLVRPDVLSITHSTQSQKHIVLSIFTTNSLRKHN